MARFFSTFYSKISTAYLWLVFLTTFGSAALIYFYWREYRDLAQQRLQWGLAETISSQLRMQVAGNLDAEKLRETLYRYHSLNPQVDIYLIDGRGQVVLSHRHYYDDSEEEVSIAPGTLG